jgi:hypothetical protein
VEVHNSDDGQFTTINDPLGPCGIYLNGANDSAAIVGFHGDSVGQIHGFELTPSHSVSVKGARKTGPKSALRPWVANVPRFWPGRGALRAKAGGQQDTLSLPPPVGVTLIQNVATERHALVVGRATISDG